MKSRESEFRHRYVLCYWQIGKLAGHLSESEVLSLEFLKCISDLSVSSDVTLRDDAGQPFEEKGEHSTIFSEYRMLYY